MRFEKLIIQNFNSYYGEHNILFNTTPDKPITIIYGKSGNGKSSIFDAINWALYGKEFEVSLQRDNEKKLVDCVNVTALEESQRDLSSVEMSSTLLFEHEDKRYRIQQAICVKLDGDTKVITDQLSTLYQTDITGNSKQIPFIESFLNQILPNNVRDYFLFNGDRVTELSMPGSSEEIRNGIYRDLDLEILQLGSEHLESSAKSFRRLSKKHAVGEVADLEEKYSQARDELDNLEKQIENDTSQIRALQDKIETIDESLRSTKDVQDIQKKRDDLQKLYTDTNNKLETTIQEIRANATLAVMNSSLDSIRKLRELLDNKRNLGEIPSTISTNLLRDILQMKKCICGNSFEQDDEMFVRLSNQLQQELSKNKQGNDLLDLYFELKQVEEMIRNANLALNEKESLRVELETGLTDMNKQIRSLNEQLERFPQENIADLGRSLQDSNEQMVNLRIGLNDAKNKKTKMEDEIKELIIEREKLSNKQLKVKEFQLRDDLAQQASDLLNKIFIDFANQSRQEVEEKTSEEFKKFIPSASQLKIGIDENFHYNVRDNLDQPALQQLSNGQKQALSLAYITSISRVSGKNPPLVIDMPLARLDEDVQLNIASRLPDIASQVILLLLPGSEWNEKTKNIFYEKSSDVYKLVFDSKLRSSSIIKEK